MVSQALATGLPVVATRHGALPEQVTDGENGLLVDEGDHVALAERLLALSEQPELLPRFGRHGRAHVREHFDAATLTQRQLAVYRDVVQARV